MGHPAPPRYLAGAYSCKDENDGGVTPFRKIDGFVTVGRCFTPVSVWSGYYTRIDRVAQDTHPFWAGPVNQCRPVHLDDASTTASLVVDPSHLLDGITASGSP